MVQNQTSGPVTNAQGHPFKGQGHKGQIFGFLTLVNIFVLIL